MTCVHVCECRHLWRPEGGRCPGVGGAVGYKPSGVGAGNQGPLQEQHAPLTAEPSLQLHFSTFNTVFSALHAKLTIHNPPAPASHLLRPQCIQTFIPSLIDCSLLI